MALRFTFKTVAVGSLLLSSICLTVSSSSSSSLIVDSPFGKIRGEIVPGASSGKNSVVFRNIPFAKPPVGDLRFAKPEPHPKIDGVFDGTDRNAVMCPQPNAFLQQMGVEQGTEDCLILNIVARADSVKSGGKLKKVMVFIHGGGFFSGWSLAHDMTTFATTHDVIGVTINYRIGILGFLSTGNEAIPGNFGLWDQTLALRWVKENIKSFGGDPDDVTISGESAGGASVGFLSLSPATKGLFVKANPQSGTATSGFAKALDVQRYALTIGKHAKCWEGEVTEKIDLEQSEKLLSCLRSKDPSDLTSFDFFFLYDPMFVPVVDGDFVPKEPSLLLEDDSYLESVGFFDRSYLVSLVNREVDILRQMNLLMKRVISNNNDMPEEQKKGTIAQIREYIKLRYLKGRLNSHEVSLSYVDRIMDFYNRRYEGDDAHIEMVSDLYFLIAAYDHLNVASRSEKSKSWFLHFDHYPLLMKGDYRGTCHTVDMMYWFDLEVSAVNNLAMVGLEGEMDEEDLQLKSLFSSVLAEFVKNGDPGLALKDHLPNGWPTYDPVNSYYLNFNLEPTVRSHLEREKRDLWLKKIPQWTRKTNEKHEHIEL